MTIRFAEKFTNSGGSLSYTFPLEAYEWSSQADLRNQPATSVGLDYAYDLLRSSIAPVNLGKESIRFFIVQTTDALVDTQLDSLKSLAYRIGKGKLWTLGADGTRRWCWARLKAMPSFSVGVQNRKFQPAVLEFQRYSPWFAENITTSTSATISASPTTYVVNNPGNIPVKIPVITLTPLGAAGYVDPTIENTTNGYSFQSLRDSVSTSSRLRFDCDRMAVEYSEDAAASWAPDWTNFNIGVNQAEMMILEPGDNNIKYTGGGTPNLTIVFSFYAQYA